MNTKNNEYVDNSLNESIYSGYPTEDNYRKDLVSHIKKTAYKDMKKISNILEYSLSPYDLIRLASEYKKGNKNFNAKVEYLLNDLNFHSECSLLINNKADELLDNSKREIWKILETYVIEKFIKQYLEHGDSGYLSKNSKELEDVSIYDCSYLIDRGYIKEYGNGYILTDSVINSKNLKKDNVLEDKKLNNNDKSSSTFLKEFFDKYKFKTRFAGQNDNFYCEVYAKNTDGKDVIWFEIQLSDHDAAYGNPFEPLLKIYGNTDQNNIWLHETRKDLSLENVLDFCMGISEICNCKLVTNHTNNQNELNIHHLVDLEDLQEFKDYKSLDDVKKYIDNHSIITDKNKEIEEEKEREIC